MPERLHHPSPTLAEIAAAVGVSTMAVSIALNQARSTARISDRTRQRILTAASRMGYQAGREIQSAERRRHQAIGVVMERQEGGINDYQMEVLRGILDEALAYGQTVATFPLPSWKVIGSRLEAFCTSPVDGLILIAPTLSRPQAQRLKGQLPVVSVHPDQRHPGIVDLADDSFGGIHLATRHLLELGHRRFLLLTGPSRREDIRQRIAGWRQAQREAGLEPDPACVVECPYIPDAGAMALDRWPSLGLGAIPSAIVCTSDILAVSCVEHLRRHGVQVPAEVSVVGYDDAPIATHCTPRLTTVCQHLPRIGRRAVQLVQELLNRDPEAGPAPEGELQPTSLVLRDSTGPAPAP